MPWQANISFINSITAVDVVDRSLMISCRVARKIVNQITSNVFLVARINQWPPRDMGGVGFEGEAVSKVEYSVRTQHNPVSAALDLVCNAWPPH